MDRRNPGHEDDGAGTRWIVHELIWSPGCRVTDPHSPTQGKLRAGAGGLPGHIPLVALC